MFFINVNNVNKDQKQNFKNISDFQKNKKNLLAQVLWNFILLHNSKRLFSKEIITNDGIRIKDYYSKCKQCYQKKLAHHINYINEKIYSYLEKLDKAGYIESVGRNTEAKEVREIINRLIGNNHQIQSCDNVNNSVDPQQHGVISDFKMIDKSNNQGRLVVIILQDREFLDIRLFSVLDDEDYYITSTSCFFSLFCPRRFPGRPWETQPYR